MKELITIYTSNKPVECYIQKCRLETEGIYCFIFWENIISVHPFWSVAMGGVQVKVPRDQVDLANKVINLVKIDKLSDELGEYNISEVYENEIKNQNEIIEIKNQIRNNPSILNNPESIHSDILSTSELKSIIISEKQFLEHSKKKYIFNWKEFCYELFDMERNFFTYLKIKPIEYYLEKDIVDKYYSTENESKEEYCPNCQSENVRFGYAFDIKWDFLYLFLSIFAAATFQAAPFPPIRKNYHCFDCGCDFKQSI